MAVDQVKQTARDRAIEAMRRTFNDAERLTEASAGDLIDAIVAAVRAPESDHTRAVEHELTAGETDRALRDSYDRAQRSNT